MWGRKWSKCNGSIENFSASKMYVEMDSKCGHPHYDNDQIHSQMAAVVSLSCTYFTILKLENKSRPVLPWPDYTLTPTSSVLSPHSASWRRKQRMRFEWGPLSLPFYFRCNNFQIDSGKNGLQRAGRRATTSGRRSLCSPALCFRPLSS